MAFSRFIRSSQFTLYALHLLFFSFNIFFFFFIFFHTWKNNWKNWILVALGFFFSIEERNEKRVEVRERRNVYCLHWWLSRAGYRRSSSRKIIGWSRLWIRRSNGVTQRLRRERQILRNELVVSTRREWEDLAILSN